MLRNKNQKYFSAFTLIEVLVVLGILSFLFVGLVFYSRTAERQIILIKEQAKIISALNKAKSLAINTFYEEEAPCGYGVYFKLPDTLIIFKDYPGVGIIQDFDERGKPIMVETTSCSFADKIYTSSDENFEEFKLDKTAGFSLLELDSIIFIPPDPEVIIRKDSAIKENALIEITTIDNKAKLSIKVTDAGQITVLE